MSIILGSDRIQLEPNTVKIKIGPGLGDIKSEFSIKMMPSIHSVS